MQLDVVGAGDRWIPQEEYQRIVRRVPIVCVDVLPLSDEATPRVGLIRRETPGGLGWCVVGGGVLLNEPVAIAVRRHVTATLGARMVLDEASLRLVTVTEYFSEPGIGELHDPRKHSVALTHVATCAGEPEPAGEAVEF